MKKFSKRSKFLISIFFAITVLAALNLLIGSTFLSNQNCIRQGDTPFKGREIAYPVEEYKKLSKSCCFGLNPYLPEAPLFSVLVGGKPTCQPFYYPIFDKIKSYFPLLLAPITWVYIISLSLIFYLIYWLATRRAG